jgi:hypothetical protein
MLDDVVSGSKSTCTQHHWKNLFLALVKARCCWLFPLFQSTDLMDTSRELFGYAFEALYGDRSRTRALNACQALYVSWCRRCTYYITYFKHLLRSNGNESNCFLFIALLTAKRRETTRPE